MTLSIAVLVVAIWGYLIGVRGQFWRCREREGGEVALPGRLPLVVAVMPARNEAALIGRAVESLARQHYAGALSIIVVDDCSQDGTARAAVRGGGPAAPLTVLAGEPLPRGWTGKVWALKQGITAAFALRPDYILLTDADIVHAPDNIAALVARAESGRLSLVSLMARLHCRSLAERFHVPAFVYFFQLLFPFAWVNDERRPLAAAAGGCMLVRADALSAIGGVDRIRNALIDDCALAAELKKTGPIWLGLSERVRSVRPYPHWPDVARMIARSAYAQLRYSPWLLFAVTWGMALTFLAPPALALLASGPARWLGLAAWVAMAVSFVPMVRFYRLSPLWGFALPLIALAYLAYTFASAWHTMRGRGGVWKGRVHADVPGVP